MKPIIFLLVILLSLFNITSGFSGVKAPEDDLITAKATGKGAWEVYHAKRGLIAKLIKEKGKEVFKLYDNKEQYVGLILQSKSLMPRTARTRTTSVTPEEARLYLDVLEVFDEIK